MTSLHDLGSDGSCIQAGIPRSDFGELRNYDVRITAQLPVTSCLGKF